MSTLLPLEDRGAAVRRARDLALAALGAEDVLLGLEAREQGRRGALVVERRVERRVGAADALAGDARGLVRPPRPLKLEKRFGILIVHFNISAEFSI